MFDNNFDTFRKVLYLQPRSPQSAGQYEVIKGKDMIIIPIKEGENIERALKKFKKKFEKTGVLKELRARKHFLKPSVHKKKLMEKARYIEGLRRAEM
jgi:small subunit ribosomal protein S21